MRWVIAIAVLLSSTIVLAQESTQDFTVTPVLERENDDALPVSEILHYVIRCGREDGGPYNDIRFTSDDNTLNSDGEAPITSPPVFESGVWYCIARTMDTEFRWSFDSNQVSFTVGRCETSDCRPKPPQFELR